MTLCVWWQQQGRELYITKHPQVHREIGKIQIEARTIKESVLDVRGGERKEGREEGFFPLKTSLVSRSKSLA